MWTIPTRAVISAAALLSVSVCYGAEGTITLESLLAEMTDRTRYARLPEPAYTLRQASSYDRGSKDPADPKGWFANQDWSHFVRSEKKDGRTEWVMMDAAGPGAVVRFWVGGPVPKGTIRFYLDGAEEPALVSKSLELFLGKGMVPPPLSAERARGWNLYLPIPYAKHCKITYDGPNFFQTRSGADRIWYNINYRTYAAGTKVEAFSKDRGEAAKKTLAQVGQALRWPDRSLPRDFPLEEHELSHLSGPLRPGMEMERALSGPGAVLKLIVQVRAKDLAAALRATVLVIAFDKQQTVWCPVGDFFGSGVGANPFKGWWRTVQKDGAMSCYWVMPFRKSCAIRLRNLGQQTIRASCDVLGGRWKWDDRSMYFHANWRQQFPLDTGRKHDWNYVTVQGRGVLMGDTLAVMNPIRTWWGEGDEKIWVDGEKFPSHFGTGTEDYYGYAWGTPRFFEAPFHAQPRCDGPGNAGHVTVTRSRALDALPFHKSLKLDMEVWHWRATKVAYAATTYWYARPGATSTPKPMPAEAARAIPMPPPPPKPVKVKGAIEGETIKILGKTGGVTEIQRIRRYKWSGDAQLWWRDAKPGDRLTLELPVRAAGKYTLTANLTKAVDYGIVRLLVDGEGLGDPIDLYNNGVVTTGPVALGVRELAAGRHKLTVEIKGANPKAIGRHMFGLDYVKLVGAK